MKFTSERCWLVENKNREYITVYAKPEANTQGRETYCYDGCLLKPPDRPIAGYFRQIARVYEHLMQSV